MADRHSLLTRWKNGKADKPLKWAAIMLGVGIALMALSDLNGSEPPEETASEPVAAAETDLKKNYESELTRVLNKIDGVSDVSVIVNLASSERSVYEKNVASSKGSGENTTDEQMAVIRNGDVESPVMTETRKPDIQGVLIVAKGVERVQVKKRMVEAVTRVLGVPMHRVAVMPGKTGGKN
ncbi:stage III sporulation protein AG [Domibacillus sp. A3M-37]|uniref:stage III sporulation protein AG n=2 Tax=Domibacillus TaxID=1433999 RepID=UPI0020B6ED69|nr:stage III sporulation protein AG [Domibacillus sp. A3M-37]MCP3763293.1 stage III sporulation protein AG [Domibacillus sp. A3M-37]